MDFFNRNYNFVMEITILPLFQKLKFLGSYSLFRYSLTSRTKISTGSSSYVKSGLSSIVSEETSCDGSNLYLFSIETWKTL